MSKFQPVFAFGRPVILGVLLSLVCLLGWAPSGWASRGASPLVFDSKTPATVAVSVYGTTLETQKDAYKTIFKASKSFYKALPGFMGFAALASSNGERVIALTQWQDSASYEAFQASLAEDSSEDYTKYYQKYVDTKADDSLNTPLFSGLFTVNRAVAPPGMVPNIPGENALVQISRFSPSDLESQTTLLTLAQKLVEETIPELYPAPRSAILLTSQDSLSVVMLTTWGAPFEFLDLSQIPRLSLNFEPREKAEPDSSLPEGETLSNTAAASVETFPLETPSMHGADDHFYQIVKVIVPQTDKD